MHYLKSASLYVLALLTLFSCAEQKPLEINFAEQQIVASGDFGLTTNLRDWRGATVTPVSKPIAVVDDYEMTTGKRLHCHNEALEYVYALTNAAGETLFVELREYSDGFAFRYRLPDVKEGELLVSEATAYRVKEGTKRWVPMFTHNSNYEQMFPLSTDGTSSARGAKDEWAYPALFEVAEGQFMLITEADMTRDHCGSYMKNTDDRDCYKVTLAEENMTLVPDENGEWTSLWRVIIAGSLADVVESTLVTDVSTPNKIGDTSWIEAAPASWIYWAYNHGSQDFKLLCEYVDLAKEMTWPYTLVDAEWDEMQNGGTVEDVAAYAKANGVKPLLWYNSTTGWIDGAPGPKYRINTPEDREKEFAWLEETGYVGAKVDFFANDKAEQMNYYIDIMEDAARHHLVMNFHGGTLPRGWQRTYPNLVSMESVYGAEWYNNVPFFTPQAAKHNATLPFTRNVIGSMDYTPGTFTDSQHPHITTHGHELALTILFESGVQHMPDRPSAYLTLPEEVKDILKSLPTAWDNTLLLAGYPGESCVMARQKGEKWYVAGINGQDEDVDIDVDLSRLGEIAEEALLVADGETQYEFNISRLAPLTSPLTIPCKARGGFVLVIE